MTRQLLVCLVLLLGLQLAAYGDDKTGKQPAPPTNPGFETMKKLAGTWLAADQDGKPTDQVVSIIKVTAGAVRFMKPSFPVSRTRWSRSTPSMGPIWS